MEKQISLFPEDEEVFREQEYKVQKSNAFIQKARFKLSVKAQKILLYAISQISDRHTPGQTMEIDIPHMCRVCGLDTTRGNYNYIYKELLAIKHAGFYFKPLASGANRPLVDWITEVTVIEANNVLDIEKAIPRKVTFKFDPRLEPYLIGLSELYTKYEIKKILPMKSAYSIRLYELLKSCTNMGQMTITVDELRELLQVPPKYTFKEFNRSVILKSKQEIEAFTELDFSAEYIRTGRKVTSIKFLVSTKTGLERDIATLRNDSAVNKKHERENERIIKALIPEVTP